MTRNTSKMVVAGRFIMSGALAVSLGLGMVGCGTSSTSGSATSEATATASADGTLAAPSDLSIDFATGDFTFQANDENMGSYYLRVYTNTDGEQGSEYVATSKRLKGGSTGEVSGNVDLSELAWGTYNFNIVSAATSGSGDTAPDPQVFTYQLGIGGTMERPEMMVLADGNEAEFYIDLYTLSDWNKMQRMPEVDFTIYSDAECTKEVKTVTVDLSDMAPQEASGPWASGTMWASDAEGTHKYLEPSADASASAGPMASSGSSDPVALVSQAVVDDLGAGTYYVTATAKGDADAEISDSQASEAVEFTLTDAEPTGEFTATKTSMWADPEYGSMGLTAQEGTYTDRVDFAGGQTTSGKVVD